MYKQEDFEIRGAKERFKNLSGKYIMEDILSVQEINAIIDKIVTNFNTYERAPKFVLTRAIYTNESKQLVNARFIIRPSINYVIESKEMKKVFTIVNSERFFDDFIENVIDWLDNYTYYAMIAVNLSKLNIKIQEIIEANNLWVDLKFTLGNGIEEITDNSIIIGLSEEVIKNLNNYHLFSEIDAWRENYEKSVINMLKECSKPYDVVKLKSVVTKELGIYQRKSINKLIRQIVNRRIDYVRVGVGYAENEELFAVIQKEAIREEDIPKYKLSEVILTDNSKMTVCEEKEGRNKIVTFFKVSPFTKKEGTPIDISIRDFLEETCKEMRYIV